MDDRSMIARRTEDIRCGGEIGKRDNRGMLPVCSVIMGRYKVLSEMESGSMGLVYCCLDETSGIKVILKALAPELSRNSVEFEAFKESFRRASGLIHQNIAVARSLEKDPVSGNYYLVMEYFAGEDLRSWMSRRQDGKVTLKEAAPVIRQIAGALDYAHKQGIIHRELCPRNVVINSDGEVKVLFFSLASQFHLSMSRLNIAEHTNSVNNRVYISPEEWQGKRPGAASDQYSFAVIVYEILAGFPPFENADPAVLQQIVLTRTPEVVPGIPEKIQNAVAKGLNKIPEKRFVNCSVLADELDLSVNTYVAPVAVGNFFQRGAAIVILIAVFAGIYWYDNSGGRFFGKGDPNQSEAADNEIVTVEEVKRELAELRQISPAVFEGKRDMPDIFCSFMKMDISPDNYDSVERDKFKFACYVSALGGKKTIQWLLDNKKVQINQVGDGGLLHFAAGAGNLEMMRFLIRRGANCSLPDNDGQVPLSWAMMQKNCLPAVKLLVESGADVNFGGERDTPLEEALDNELWDVVNYLRSKGAVK